MVSRNWCDRAPKTDGSTAIKGMLKAAITTPEHDGSPPQAMGRDDLGARFRPTASAPQVWRRWLPAAFNSCKLLLSSIHGGGAHSPRAVRLATTMGQATQAPSLETRPERCLVRIPVHVRIRESGVPVFAQAISSNLSVAGMYVKGQLAPDFESEPPSVGSRLSLRLALPELGSAFELLAEVVWVNPRDMDASGASALGLGVRFMSTPSRFDKAVEHFIAEFRYHVLIVDDEVTTLEIAERALGDQYRVSTTAHATQVLGYLDKEDVAVLILGQRMPEITVIELLEEVNKRYPKLATARIVLSACSDPDVVRSLVNQCRIFYHFEKPIEVTELKHVVDAAVAHYVLIVENERLNSELVRSNERLLQDNLNLRARMTRTQEFHNIIGDSAEIREVLQRLEQVAEYPTTVHIRGETGTGKELVARAIHAASPRRDRNFVAYNCAGIPDALVQSTLLGYKKGAFTGAIEDRKGVFEEADGGTVFLDEVGDISPTVQTSLLRVLQEGEVVPVGATKSTKVDVRIISATHHDLRADFQEGSFREDLYYRLVVAEITLPPLRDRIGDIPLLAESFLDLIGSKFNKKLRGFTPSCVSLLNGYDWPGNVRELENEINRAVIHATEQRLDVTDLSPTIRASAASSQLVEGYSGMSLPEVVQDTERQMIRDAMTRCNNVVTRAAEMLGVQGSTLHKKMKRLGL